jgi:hypothetical protein
MKGYVCLVLLLVGTALFAQSNATPEEAAVLRVQQQWLEASQKGNGEILSQIIDDSFAGSTPDNHIINKQSLFPASGSEPMFTNTHFVSLNARVIGNTAVVFGSMVTTGDPTVLRRDGSIRPGGQRPSNSLERSRRGGYPTPIRGSGVNLEVHGVNTWRRTQHLKVIDGVIPGASACKASEPSEVTDTHRGGCGEVIPRSGVGPR